MEKLQEFVSMGGYGAYIWGAYGLCAIVMILLVFTTVRRLRANERTLATLKDLRRGGGGEAERGGQPAEGQKDAP